MVSVQGCIYSGSQKAHPDLLLQAPPGADLDTHRLSTRICFYQDATALNLVVSNQPVGIEQQQQGRCQIAGDGGYAGADQADLR